MLFLRPVYLKLTEFHPRLEDVIKIHRYFTHGGGWVGENAARPEFHCEDPHRGRRELTPVSCPPSCTHSLWYACVHAYTCTHTQSVYMCLYVICMCNNKCNNFLVSWNCSSWHRFFIQLTKVWTSSLNTDEIRFSWAPKMFIWFRVSSQFKGY